MDCRRWLLALGLGLAIALGAGCHAPTGAPSDSAAVDDRPSPRTIGRAGSPAEDPEAARPAPADPAGESQIARRFRALLAERGTAVSPPASATAPGCPRFSEIAAIAQISHVYHNGASGHLLMVEPTGGGCGWIDYDRDGAIDLYFNQGGDPAARPSSAQPADALFRNQATGRFADVTLSSAIDERGYSQGVAVGDYDNDGFDDLLVTNVGADALYRNQGDGTFVDVTAATIGFDSLWSSSAAWADLDLDGDLDLYLCNYVDFDPFDPVECRNARGEVMMCQPNQIEPVGDECYFNQGDGRFLPLARERGLEGPGNRALGVAVADFDNDGWPDVYVANDATANFLFVNQRDGRFVDQATLLGCAVSSEGSAQASMGVAVGDYDRNGYLDLFLTHFEGEWNTLYRNLGPQGYQDVSGVLGLVPPVLSLVGFGTVMADFDQDGLVELFVANGHLDDPGHLGVELEMPPTLFHFDGRRWHDCGARAGSYFDGRYVGRGVAAADFDNDGDLDLAVVHQNRPAALLRNDSQRGAWLMLQFIGRQCNRNAVGTRVDLQCGDRTLVQEVVGGASYCSASQRALVFGLGQQRGPCRLEIRWPGGATQTLDAVEINRSLTLTEPVDR